MSQIVEIIFNGEPRAITSTTVAALLSELGLSEKRLAVELNRVIVPKTNYTDTPVAAGDSVEIVTFVGGG